MFEKRKVRISLVFFLLMSFLLAAAGCSSGEKEAVPEKSAPLSGEKEAVIGVVLTSRDAAENEEAIAEFEKAADKSGAELRVLIPDVSSEEASEAAALKYGDFVLCDVDPVEFQMLHINELVAENVSVIAVHANHGEALEGVLKAARDVGIEICAWGQELTDGSCDSCVETAEEAARSAAAYLEAAGK